MEAEGAMRIENLSAKDREIIRFSFRVNLVYALCTHTFILRRNIIDVNDNSLFKWNRWGPIGYVCYFLQVS